MSVRAWSLQTTSRATLSSRFQATAIRSEATGTCPSKTRERASPLGHEPRAMLPEETLLLRDQWGQHGELEGRTASTSGLGRAVPPTDLLRIENAGRGGLAR